MIMYPYYLALNHRQAQQFGITDTAVAVSECDERLRK